jgi:molecular chaperone GrpE
VEALKKQLEQVKAELKETHDKYLFELAEAQNVRTRARREVENATKFGVTKFAQSLLDVADNLSRAIGAVPAEERKGGLYTGIVMTEKELAKAFEANGITKVPSMGVAFNPDVHQAMLETPADEAKGLTPGKVSLVLREGYSLHGRVIRPAQVGVVKSD